MSEKEDDNDDKKCMILLVLTHAHTLHRIVFTIPSHSNDSTLSCLVQKTSEIHTVFTFSDNIITSVCFENDTTCYIASDLGNIMQLVLNVKKNTVLARTFITPIIGNERGSAIVAMSGHGPWLCTVNGDGILAVYRKTSGKCLFQENLTPIFTQNDQENAVASCHFLTHEQHLLLVSYGSSCILAGFRILEEPRGNLTVNCYRTFHMPDEQRNSIDTNHNSPHLIDMTSSDHLYSLWTDTVSEWIVVHERPSSITGPRTTVGQTLGSRTQMEKQVWQHDDLLVEELVLDDVQSWGTAYLSYKLDGFYLTRLLLPGRFSKSIFKEAMVQLNSTFRVTLKMDSFQECRETLRGFIANLCSLHTESFAHRLEAWKHLLNTCIEVC